jgi:hypothetical protein
MSPALGYTLAEENTTKMRLKFDVDAYRNRRIFVVTPFYYIILVLVTLYITNLT